MKRLATALTDLLRKDGPGGFAKVIATLTQLYNWPEDTSVVHQMAELTRSITPAKLITQLLTIASNEVLTIASNEVLIMTKNNVNYRAQWLRGRASDSQLREPGFESCAAVLKLGKFFHYTLLQFTLYKCINEYLT